MEDSSHSLFILRFNFATKTLSPLFLVLKSRIFAFILPSSIIKVYTSTPVFRRWNARLVSSRN
jgi:hypothetical protein